jgi:hypothetical protein
MASHSSRGNFFDIFIEYSLTLSRHQSVGNANEKALFDFTRRSPQSDIQNVIFVTLESMRADVFDMESDAALQYLTNATRDKFNHAPFMASLRSESLFVSQAVSTDGYLPSSSNHYILGTRLNR